MCEDGVHLTSAWNCTAAVSLCHRLLETEEEGWSEDGGSAKRMRIG